MPAYAVVDSAQQGGFHKRLDRYGVRYRSLFDGYAEAKLLEIAPLLVELSGSATREQARAWREIEQLGRQRPAVSLVRSELPLEELARHLGRFHTVRLPERQEMILRWYDTRILPVWMKVLSEPQRTGFVQGIHEWTIWDRYGDAVELRLPVDRPQFAPLAPYELDESQYAQLLAASETDTLIAHLRDVIRDETHALPHRVLYPFVDTHLNEARRHGLNELDERAAYLLLALYTSGGFASHPLVGSRLAAGAGELESPFAAWVESLPDEVWESGPPLWHAMPPPRCEETS